MLLSRTGEMAVEDRVVGGVGDQELFPLPLGVLFQHRLIHGGLQTSCFRGRTASAAVDFPRLHGFYYLLLGPYVDLKGLLASPCKTESTRQQLSLTSALGALYYQWL